MRQLTSLLAFTILGSLILSFTACQVDHEHRGTPPNIILIMADDLGYGGIGCYGNEVIETPNLDLMAQKGLKFTDFHSNGCVCTPTRAALLTGQYQQRSGMEGVIYVKGETRQVGMDTTVTTIAEALKNNHYATGIIGKWHLGYRKEFNPVLQGFDEFYGYVSGNIDFHSHYDNAGIYDWWHNQDSIFEKGYVTDLITQHAIQFIENHQDKPFFLYVPHEAPHAPFQGRNDPGYRYPNMEFSYHGPVEDKHAAYKEMVEVMDEGVGEILNKLEDLQLLENTLVMFFSDNGGERQYGDNGPLRGHKTNLYEGGHRVPAIAYWPNRVKAGIIEEPIMTFDLFPTILKLTNTPSPQKLVLDGIDISPILLGNGAIPERFLFWRYRGQKVARKGNWKLIMTKQDTALYNLKQDLVEKNNLAESEAQKCEVLVNALSAWEKDINQVVQITN